MIPCPGVFTKIDATPYTYVNERITPYLVSCIPGTTVQKNTVGRWQCVFYVISFFPTYTYVSYNELLSLRHCCFYLLIFCYHILNFWHWIHPFSLTHCHTRPNSPHRQRAATLHKTNSNTKVSGKIYTWYISLVFRKRKKEKIIKRKTTKWPGTRKMPNGG